MTRKQWLAADLIMAVATGMALSPVMAGEGHDKHDKEGVRKQCSKGECKRNKAEKREKFYQELGVSDEQKASLKASKEAFKEQNAGKFEAMKVKREQLKAMREAGQGDSDEAKALKEELKAEKQAMHQQHEANMKAVLTPEQFEKWQTKQAERKTKWEAKKQERKQRKQDKAPAEN